MKILVNRSLSLILFGFALFCSPLDSAWAKYEFPVKGQAGPVGVIDLVTLPDAIDKAKSENILVESFIGEYQKYLTPGEIGEGLTTWRGGEKSVQKYYQDYFRTEWKDFSEGILHYWVEARVNGELAGWATFQREKNEKNSVYMNLLVVLPKFQGGGIGTKLVFSLMNLKQFSQLRSIHVLLRKKNQGARKFYSKLGFYSDPSYERADNFVDRKLLEGWTWESPKKKSASNSNLGL